MVNRTAAMLAVASLFSLNCVSPRPALAENAMGYQLLSAGQAAQLPRGGGTLGMDVGAGQHITDAGMTFELLQVKGVRQGSPAARAGLSAGDQVIAVDGRVFPSVAAFAAYAGSMRPGQQISVDDIPAGGGPQQAQRVTVTVGGSGHGPSQQTAQSRPSTGLSTGSKVAIGVGAAALFGCYELGCFSHAKTPAANVGQQPAASPAQQPGTGDRGAGQP